MWSPTHVQVTVLRARNLLIKGKNGTNDAFVTIQLGKDKYQTSTIEKANSPSWNEECDMLIPDMNASLILTVQHKNFLGIDEFLGQLTLPLSDLDIYERPKNKWHSLNAKPGKSKDKEHKNRGELEVRNTFFVRSVSDSTSDLSKKYKRTTSLTFRTMASSVGQKMRLPRSLSLRDSKFESRTAPSGSSEIESEQDEEEHLPVKSTIPSGEGKEDTQPDIIRRSLRDIRGSRIAPLKELREHYLSLPYMEEKGFENSSRSNRRHTLQGLNLPDYKSFDKQTDDLNVSNSLQAIPTSTNLPPNIIKQYGQLSNEELLHVINTQKMALDKKEHQIRELESYIDNLLVRVMETTPRILQKPFKNGPRS